MADERPVAVVVDDDSGLRDVVRFRLELDGWKVVDAATGSEAMRLISDETPAAVILDQRLPDVAGVDLARALRRRGYDRLIVLFSAWFSPSVAVDAGPAGLAVVSKLNFDVLWELLDDVRSVAPHQRSGGTGFG